MTSSEIYLITGGTGGQGGATLHALMTASFHRSITIRVLVRDPTSVAAQHVASVSSPSARVEVIKGDLNDIGSLKTALAGVTGVFSVQNPGPDEITQGQNLVQAAKQCGVRVFVHTSVSMTGKHESFPKWNADYPLAWYWLGKHEVEEAVRKAHFDYYTILRPAYFMDNFRKPRCIMLFPEYATQGLIHTLVQPSTPMQLIATEDIGKFAAAAFVDPIKFNGLEIELAAEWLTFPQIAQLITQVTGKNVKSESVPTENALSSGIEPQMVESQIWCNDVGYIAADANKTKSYGIPMISFENWLHLHKNDVIDSLP
jgi:uncharacterized protein YbjT (DUF2867 family)